MWISSSYLVPVINCEDVRLGDEIVESISQVDPVKKFGLFSAQTFTVAGFNESDQVIKVSLKRHLISIIVWFCAVIGYLLCGLHGTVLRIQITYSVL